MPFPFWRPPTATCQSPNDSEAAAAHKADLSIRRANVRFLGVKRTSRGHALSLLLRQKADGWGGARLTEWQREKAARKNCEHRIEKRLRGSRTRDGRAPVSANANAVSRVAKADRSTGEGASGRELQMWACTPLRRRVRIKFAPRLHSASSPQPKKFRGCRRSFECEFESVLGGCTGRPMLF
jgi:hypothetical protein